MKHMVFPRMAYARRSHGLCVRMLRQHYPRHMPGISSTRRLSPQRNKRRVAIKRTSRASIRHSPIAKKHDRNIQRLRTRRHLCRHVPKLLRSIHGLHVHGVLPRRLLRLHRMRRRPLFPIQICSIRQRELRSTDLQGRGGRVEP